jgi:O-antigen biosynthesis protein
MKGKISWLVPYPIKGSGGHRTIFAHIRNLVSRGHECHVFIGEDPNENMDPGVIKGIAETYFGPCPAQIHRGYKVDEHFDMAIATAWWTAEEVASNIKAEHKVYFVQDFEPCFNPMGDYYIQAENSYEQGLVPLTIGRWLSKLLNERFDSPRNHFEFTADSTVYFPIPDAVKENAVCFIYQPEKPRRCALIGEQTLAILKHHSPDITIYTYGSNEPPPFDFEHTHLGVLTLEECNELYNRCSAALCLSSSNPSRVPFEMMASGLPTVDFHDDNTIYDFPEGGVLLAAKNPSSLAGALLKIISSKELQNSMRDVGLAFMKGRPAELEFEQCAQRIEAILTGVYPSDEPFSPLYTSIPVVDELKPPPKKVKQEDIAKVDEVRELLCFGDRLVDNRIVRVLKVLWRGYY